VQEQGCAEMVLVVGNSAGLTFILSSMIKTKRLALMNTFDKRLVTSSLTAGDVGRVTKIMTRPFLTTRSMMDTTTSISRVLYVVALLLMIMFPPVLVRMYCVMCIATLSDAVLVKVCLFRTLTSSRLRLGSLVR
jgi:hypothetical protein